MWWSPAWNNVVLFGQSWEAQIKLRRILTTMQLHPARIDVTQERPILWLMEHVHTDNSQHPGYKEAKRLLIFLYNNRLINAYKMLWEVA